ncbi:unnamed protein product [Adineta steineri]|uniref:L-type lectin-like domain-containing protein n=1 Tax=Adineta steineri TaxID=433720 RepID=A0A818U249_9BILA|nr:unnamed protein product [Adineta steineri]
MYVNVIIFFLVILVVNHTYEADSNPFEVREHSLTRPYPTVFSTSNSYWRLTGSTIATDRYIRLTSDAQSKAGGLWSNIPVNYPDWEIHVQFRVFGEGVGYFGDGFVIWYARDPNVDGPVFGYKDYFHGLAIVMDTYGNYVGPREHVYPYISAIVNNGSLHYDHDRDGIDINISGCESSFRGLTTDTVVAIRYENNRLTVSTDTEGTNTWTPCFTINKIHLPTNYYFGFTAATGQLSDNHDIISVRTYRLDSNEQRQEENRNHIVPSGPIPMVSQANVTMSQITSWSALKIFFYTILMILICITGLASFFYMKHYRYRKPRFY